MNFLTMAKNLCLPLLVVFVLRGVSILIGALMWAVISQGAPSVICWCSANRPFYLWPITTPYMNHLRKEEEGKIEERLRWSDGNRDLRRHCRQMQGIEQYEGEWFAPATLLNSGMCQLQNHSRIISVDFPGYSWHFCWSTWQKLPV